MMSWVWSYFKYISWSSSMHSWYSTWFLLPLAGIYTHNIIITLLFAPSSSIHWIFSEPSGKVLTRWSMFFFHKIAIPPYPQDNDTGRSGSFISTPFATKLMSLLMSEIILVCEWKSQCSCIKIMSFSFKISLIELPQVLMFLQLYEVNLILFSWFSLFNIDVCSFEVDCCSLKKGTLVDVLGISRIYPLPICFSLGTILVVWPGWSGGLSTY